MAKSLKQQIEYVGLDYKKEMSKIFVFNLLFLLIGAAGYYFSRSLVILIVSVVLLGVINYFLFSSYSSKKKAMEKDHSEEFIYIISCFRIFVSNGNNVYQSFNKLIEYSSDWMKDKLEIFLKQIDDDKSIKPFMDFAEKFNMPVARNLLVSIYQMVEQGETGEQLNQFVILFEQMNQMINEEKKDRKLRSFDIVSFFPVIGAGIVTLSLTFSMLSLVGDMMNVI